MIRNESWDIECQLQRIGFLRKPIIAPLHALGSMAIGHQKPALRGSGNVPLNAY
jgi:hypothetical protein